MHVIFLMSGPSKQNIRYKNHVLWRIRSDHIIRVTAASQFQKGSPRIEKVRQQLPIDSGIDYHFIPIKVKVHFSYVLCPVFSYLMWINKQNKLLHCCVDKLFVFSSNIAKWPNNVFVELNLRMNDWTRVLYLNRNIFKV